MQAQPVVNWRNPLQEARLLLLEQKPDDYTEYVRQLRQYVDAQMFATSSTVRYTDAGLWYVQREGALRNAAMSANVAMRIAQHIDEVRAGGSGVLRFLCVLRS